MNQRSLAAQVRKEDGGTISQQYLNDIENGRRNPAGTFLIHELAKALDADPAYLTYIAGQLPEELQDVIDSPEALRSAIDAFLSALKQKRSPHR